MSATINYPYYPRHHFPEKSWPYHVPQCRLRYKAEQNGEPTEECPYSARHVVKASRLPAHLESCEVRLAEMAEKAFQRRPKGKIEAPEPTQLYSFEWEDAVGRDPDGFPLSTLDSALREDQEDFVRKQPRVDHRRASN